MSEREWLDSLKPGDELLIESGYGYHTYERAIVERRTPSGRIVTKGLEFHPDGTQRGGSSYTRLSVVKPTPERCEQADRRLMIDRLSNVKWATIDTDVLRRVVALLEEK